jgi:hypothetical protein
MKKYFLLFLLLLPFSASAYTDNTLLKANNDVKVYAIQNNHKHWIRTAEIFNSYGFKWSDIQSVSASDLIAIPDANLMKTASDPSVFLISNNYKRHIPSPLVFDSYNLNWNAIATINQTEMDSYATTLLIKSTNDSKVYAIENSSKRWIPDAETFYKNNYKWEEIQIVNDTELNSYWTGSNKDIPQVVEQTTTSTTYTITSSAGANGTISPSNLTTVNSGTNQTFTIVPATNYKIFDVLVDGKSIGSISSYTFSNITTNHTISVTFTLNSVATHTITSSAGANGTISPSGIVTVNSGANKTFTITPATNYKITDVTVDGSSVGIVNSYTFYNVTANHTISVNFAQNTLTTYTITATNGANGAISPSGLITLKSGTNQIFTITPNTGYEITDVLVDGISKGKENNYTFSNITANHTIEASFSLISNVTITSDKNEIGGNGQDTATITVKVTNTDGSPIGNKTIQETNPKIQTLITDTNGLAFFTVTSTQAGNLYVTVSVDNQYYKKSISVINTIGNVSMGFGFSGESGEHPRAPASDQRLATFTAHSIDSSISELKLKSLKLKLINLDQTWFKNVRITNSPPCEIGRFCSSRGYPATIAGPASYNLGSDGILTIIPDTPISMYVQKPIYVIADMINTTNLDAGTGNPILTYQISLPNLNAIEITGKVNGYDKNTINLNNINISGYTPFTNAIIPVTATLKSNYCSDSTTGKLVPCY